MSSVVSYGRASRAPAYGFVVGLALFALYEGFAVLLNTSLRNGADVWLIRWLPFSESVSMWTIKGLALLSLGLLFLWRNHRAPLRAVYLLGVVLESTLYSLLLGSVVLFILDKTPVLMGATGNGLPVQLTLSLGAGLYEELLFRVLLFGGLAALLKAFHLQSWVSLLLAALISAVLFSAAHHIGSLGEPFEWSRFAYRLVSGFLFTGLYVGRGFGITALTHALYDIWVTVGLV